jgi:hypothetical protein
VILLGGLIFRRPIFKYYADITLIITLSSFVVINRCTVLIKPLSFKLHGLITLSIDGYGDDLVLLVSALSRQAPGGSKGF